MLFFFFSSRSRHTSWTGDWSSDVCSSDLRCLTSRFDAASIVPSVPCAAAPRIDRAERVRHHHASKTAIASAQSAKLANATPRQNTGVPAGAAVLRARAGDTAAFWLVAATLGAGGGAGV